MGFYSIVAIARQPLALPDPLVLMDRGHNAVTVQTEDIQALCAKLKDEGAEILQVNRLDEHEPIQPTFLTAEEAPQLHAPDPKSDVD